jgi:hypothetical protein
MLVHLVRGENLWSFSPSLRPEVWTLGARREWSFAMKKLNVNNLIEVINSDTGNAMHSILGFLELLSEGALDPAQRAYVDACRDTADRHCRG